MKSASARRKNAMKRRLAGALVLMMTIGGIAARPASAAPSTGGFVPVTPYRVVDTRHGQGAPAQPLASGQTLEFGIGSGVPASASAVALNVTATEPGIPGFLAVYPQGSALPSTSNVNFVGGQTVPNMAVVGLHGATAASLYNFGGPTQVVVDVAGYFTDGFTPTATPRRLLDSRHGGAFRAGERRSLPVEVAGATAVVLNVTATNPTGAGYLTVVPRGASTATSSVNFDAGHTVANMVTVGLSGGSFDVVNAIGTTDVVVDVFGYYTGDGFRVETPRRVMDSRAGHCGSRMRPGEERLVTTGTTGAAVALNVTAAGGDGSGYLVVYPSGSGGRPTASNVNYTAGQNVANMALVGKGADGYVALFNYGASVDVVVDVVGSFGDAGRADPVTCVVVAPPARTGRCRGASAAGRNGERRDAGRRR